MTGATIWQGPHQTAQKSTITSSEAFMTSASHVESSTFSASPATSHSSFSEYTIILGNDRASYTSPLRGVKSAEPASRTPQRTAEYSMQTIPTVHTSCASRYFDHHPLPPISGCGMTDCGLPYAPPGDAHGNPRSPQSKGLRILFSTAVP